MSLGDRVKDELIKQVIQAMISRANSRFDMEEVLKKYSAENRTMNIIITDLGDGYSFAVNDGKMIISSVENPTCIVSMNKQTFSAIATGKVTQSQAFLMDAVNIKGKDWLRDSIVLNKIFEEIKAVMLKRV